MRIINNLISLNTYNSMRKTNAKVSTSMGRLSSGLKISSAKDDAAGFAISKKLERQIKGISQGSSNALDGTSMLQTAEGALTQVHEMLQRMRSLAVQSGNGVYTDSDRKNIQEEINNLKEEINGIAERTEFNGIKLLNGDASRMALDSDVLGAETIYVSDEVNSGILKYGLASKSEPATVNGYDFQNMGPATESGSIVINGATVEVAKGDSSDVLYEKFQNAFKSAGLEYDGATRTLSTIEVGAKQSINISGTPEALNDLNLQSVTPKDGKDMVIIGNKLLEDGTLDTEFNNSMTIKVDGNIASFISSNGQEIQIRVDEDVKVGGFLYSDIKDLGRTNIQVSAGAENEVKLYIDRVDTVSLGIEYLNLGTLESSSEALDDLDNAIDKVSEIRSNLGAQINRMEFTIKSVNIANENTQQSLSRIRDTDMAFEMTEYTKANVLYQAATSIMAQANQRPQEILQLLQ
ncbi:MAG: flagellin [Lachnospirales bacterium]